MPRYFFLPRVGEHYDHGFRGYNKFLKMEGNIKVAIDYDKIEADAKWDGLKGYLTNTNIPACEVRAAYHNLWHVEKAFRISKGHLLNIPNNEQGERYKTPQRG